MHEQPWDPEPVEEPEAFDYRKLLAYERKRTLSFSEFVELFLDNPDAYLQTSASIITDAIKYYGFNMVVRGGEPVLSYRIFKDIFTNNINAVYGQEFCIKRIVDAIESVEKESGPKRGIVLVGPPASGKTNIVDLISRALEEYTKEKDVRLFSFFFRFRNESGRDVEIRSPLMHHPLLLFPTILECPDGSVMRPRQELFDHLNTRRGTYRRVSIPSFYRYATLDRGSLEIISGLMQSSANNGKTMADVFEEYVGVEEVQFSNAQARGIANIDDMRSLHARMTQLQLSRDDIAVVSQHLPGVAMQSYEGAMLASNRGLLHIHDAFGIQGSGSPNEDDYKPLLMLLGSGKISLHWTQASIDNTVVMTTNLEEMDMLERHLASSKLLDRIEKVPVNYLLDANSEMDILRRDMANMRDKYDVDPNLLRIAAYYSVMTRLMPPNPGSTPPRWSPERKRLYGSITPEQKLFIYASESTDPVSVIKNLPHWHPFRNECLRVGVNIFEPELYRDLIEVHPDAISLEDSGLFSHDQLKLIDDDMMRRLRHEHYPIEGQHGMSIRQLQNIIRNTISHSDGIKVTVGIFLEQLDRIVTEGPKVHHWLSVNPAPEDGGSSVPARQLGPILLQPGEGDYGYFKQLVKVVRGLYYMIIQREITVATVDRDPKRIALDLRKYLQHALLARALENKAFAHIMAPQFVFIDPDTGTKVERPDDNYLMSIEKVIAPDKPPALLRQEIAQKFLDLRDRGELLLDEGKSVVSSRNDNLLACFATEYHALLSHRREMDGMDPELVRDAFFHKKNSPEKYKYLDESTRTFAETILGNLRNRFGYSSDIALDTVVFALRHDIIDFKRIIS